MFEKDFYVRKNKAGFLTYGLPEDDALSTKSGLPSAISYVKNEI